MNSASGSARRVARQLTREGLSVSWRLGGFREILRHAMLVRIQGRVRAGRWGVGAVCSHLLFDLPCVSRLRVCVSRSLLRVTRQSRSVGSELGKPLAYLTSSKFEHIPGGEVLVLPPLSMLCSRS